MTASVLLDLAAPIFVLGMPRSGTSWLSQIFESSPDCLVRLSPNYSYPLKNRLSIDTSLADWLEALRLAAESDDPFMTQNWRRNTGEFTRFPDALTRKACRLVIKDTRFHAVYQSGMSLMPRAKAVVIVRHPAAMLWSWRSCKEFPSGGDFSRDWRSGACKKGEGPGEYWGFDDWKVLTLEYCRLAQAWPERYCIIRYEALVNDPKAVVAGVFSFLGLEVSKQTKQFLRDSQSVHDSRPYAICKSRSVATAWKEHFPEEILKEIRDEVAGTILARFIQ